MIGADNLSVIFGLLLKGLRLFVFLAGVKVKGRWQVDREKRSMWYDVLYENKSS